MFMTALTQILTVIAIATHLLENWTKLKAASAMENVGVMRESITFKCREIFYKSFIELI